MFSLTIGVSSEKIVTYTPNIAVFDNVFNEYMTRLNEMLSSVLLFRNEKCFNPFTQPILHKRLENYKSDDPVVPFLGHSEKCSELMSELLAFTKNAFGLCETTMMPHTETAFKFCGESGTEKEENDQDQVETDVEVLKSTLATLQREQHEIKIISDSKTISFFKVDLRLFKRTILPNISKAIIKLQESLPKVGREKMEAFSVEARELKDLIEFEPKMTEDYVRNMDIVQKMNDKFDRLEYKLLSIENVYGIMNEIPIPVSNDDKSALKGLKANMNSLAQKIQDRIQLQKTVLPLFQQQLLHEEKLLRETINEALKEITNPSLLDSEASLEEVRPILKKIENILSHSREKAIRYLGYEKEYGFITTEYPELESAEKTLGALETLWSGIEEWDQLYDEWTMVAFDLLDVQDTRQKSERIFQMVQSSQLVLGENPIAKELFEKVHQMLTNIPCLSDLKANFLKDRHWKQISDVVGTDLKANKLTLGFLEQNNIFNFTTQVVKIVRAAEMEEQLDCLIEDLRQSWTENKLEMELFHNIYKVKNFSVIYETISKSRLTLKQLGSSQYGTEMRSQLVEWFRVVEMASKAIEVIKAIQEEWLRQEHLLNSMLCEEEMPFVHTLFMKIRGKLAFWFHTLYQAQCIKDIVCDEELVLTLMDIKISLRETAKSVSTALNAMRLRSPMLFFLDDDEIVSLMANCHQDIKALEMYLFKIFSWFLALNIVPETEQNFKNKVIKWIID